MSQALGLLAAAKSWDNQRCNTMTIDGGLKLTNVITLSATAATTLTAAQSGALIMMPQATANTVITLPAVAAGLKFKFVLRAVANGSNTQTISSATVGQLNGTVWGVIANPVGVSFTGKNSVILSATAANSVVGDWVEFTSDGLLWYVVGWSNGTAAGWTAP